MNMNKLITTAFLMTLASASYGQELTYLHCTHSEISAESTKVPSRIIVLDLESSKWNNFMIFYDEDLELLREEDILERNRIISGEPLDFLISDLSSSSLTLGGAFSFQLDRITGDMSYGQGWSIRKGKLVASCSPIDKASLEILLQERIDLRDEMIRANEAKRLF